MTTVRNADMHGELFYSAVVPHNYTHPVASLADEIMRAQTYTRPSNVATYKKLNIKIKLIKKL